MSLETRTDKKRVQLYYDVLSPYSWIAFEILCRYRSKWNMTLEFCPFLLGGIMKGAGNRAPGMVPAKATYMGKDLMRLAQYCKIPINAPKNVAEVMFQKGSLSAQRLLVVAASECPGKLEELSRQLWMRIWSRGEDITERSSLLEAGLKAGISEDVVVKMADAIATNGIKEKLKQQTQEALDLGCFGSPFIVVNMEDGRKETFFGSDRMELMANVIGEKWEGPLPVTQ